MLRLVAREHEARFPLLSEKIDALNREGRHRREAEAQREQLIAELNRTLLLSETFVAVLGHDLRNPLGAVVAGATLALRRIDDVKARGHLERVLRSARRMARMVDQLLDVSRVRLGRGIPLVRAEIDLTELVRQAAAETEPTHRQHHFDLRLPARCEGEWDRDRLAQVLTNLLSNACEHSEAGSVVTVTLGEGPAHATVSVHNPGRPIPPRSSRPSSMHSRAARRAAGSGSASTSPARSRAPTKATSRSSRRRRPARRSPSPCPAAPPDGAARANTPLPQLLDDPPVPGRAGGTR